MHNSFVYPSSDTLSRPSRCILLAASSKVSLAQPSPHLSLLRSIINTSLHSSFFSLFWSGPPLCFVHATLYLCLLWTRFCALEFAIASLLQHKQNKPTKLTPPNHLCNDPSIVPLKALHTCSSLQALCIHRNPCAGSVIKNLIQEHRQVQHKACCWHSAEKHNPINHRSRKPLCLPTCRQQYTLTKFQVPVHFAYSEIWTLGSL